ncbi:DUF2235 domain-containing protein [Pseudomonas sp.]|uniref:T6SS phospholipase effector Tle1-like catalytic domain-containing protein n=1 Tax=Pseudomonas sp. TaxID=306 RepID=UPI00262877C2|nr:DUF2235 domain-containing protein [Pseudomonas sp.]
MKEHDPKSCRICQANRPKGIEDMTPQQLAAREELQKPYLAGVAAGEAQRAAAARRVAEHNAKERAAKIKVFLVIGVFFDGTGNNASNTELGIACGAHHPIEPEDLDASCKPYMADPNSSYGNDFTNVRKLSDLYFAPDKLQPDDQGKIAYRKIYVDGIGTIAGEKDSFIGLSSGRGETGAAERVASVFDRVNRIVQDIYKANNNYEIIGILFDTFGFSRGAAAARHFATEVARGNRGPLKYVLNSNKDAFSPTFADKYKDGIDMGFIGLFDTVAATAGLDNGFNVSSGITPGLNIVLPKSDFKDVVHLVARDEYRDNFALNRIGPEQLEIALPGVHSNLGGGYRLESDECVLVSPMQGLTVAANCDVKTTSIYQDALQAKQKMIAEGWPVEMLEVITPPPVELAIDPQDRMAPQEKRVFAGLQLKRAMRGDLSRVYLRVMYELAKQKKVTFHDLKETDSEYALPPELRLLRDRFVAGDYSTTPDEEAQLKLRYIHTSANWSHPATHNDGRGQKFVYINAPTKTGIRVKHPHIAGGQK